MEVEAKVPALVISSTEVGAPGDTIAVQKTTPRTERTTLMVIDVDDIVESTKVTFGGAVLKIKPRQSGEGEDVGSAVGLRYSVGKELRALLGRKLLLGEELCEELDGPAVGFSDELEIGPDEIGRKVGDGLEKFDSLVGFVEGRTEGH